jgi:hypothetical protein
MEIPKPTTGHRIPLSVPLILATMF